MVRAAIKFKIRLYFSFLKWSILFVLVSFDFRIETFDQFCVADRLYFFTYQTSTHIPWDYNFHA